MATATASVSSAFQPLPLDVYRGAVVEVSFSVPSLFIFLTLDFRFQDLQLPPAFSISANEAISRAIELAYERDFSHIPSVRSPASVLFQLLKIGTLSVLDRRRRPLGYVDVTKLKEIWEAGQANPVCIILFLLL